MVTWDMGTNGIAHHDVLPSTSNKLSNFFKNPKERMREALRSTFLPSGYPGQTPSFFVQYSMWSMLQDLSTQLRGVLATQRILEGLGVGREGATVLSASLNFIIRDGVGMLVSLIFTGIASSGFSSDIKRWRMFADLMVDLGITLEVLAVSAPRRLFLPLLCELSS